MPSPSAAHAEQTGHRDWPCRPFADHALYGSLRDQRGHVIHMHHFDEKSVPEVTFSLKALSPSSTLVPFIHCNLYGLWCAPAAVCRVRRSSRWS